MPPTVQPLNTDFIVVGSGLAGLRAATEIAQAQREVWLLTKDMAEDSSTRWAQGGIAAALSDEDRVGFHERDTLEAGDGLSEPAAVRILVEEGPRYVMELIDWGTEFDREGFRLHFTQEGAHSARRVLHAEGDSTGREIVRALLMKTATFPNIRFVPHAFTATINNPQAASIKLTATPCPVSESSKVVKLALSAGPQCCWRKSLTMCKTRWSWAFLLKTS